MINGGDLRVFNLASVKIKGFECPVGNRNNGKDGSLEVTANISALRNKVKGLVREYNPLRQR